MKNRAYKILIFFLLISAKIVLGQTKSNPICFNHSLLVLDSTTYKAVMQSDFLLNQFAYAEERQLTGYKGFYLFGSTNYIELFHQNSFDGEVLEKGEIYLCFASLKANYLNSIYNDDSNSIKYSSDENDNYLSIFINDSVYPTIETCEMQQGHYESWTHKAFNDSLVFLPVDYNSVEDSDSSFSYLMNDVIGVSISLSKKDTASVIEYLNTIGFKQITATEGVLKFISNEQFVELDINEQNNPITINKYYIRLNKTVELKTEIIGNSVLMCNEKIAIWTFN